MTHQGYGANGLPNANSAGSNVAPPPAGPELARSGAAKPSGTASAAVALPKATLVWLGVGSFVSMVVLAAAVLTDGSLMGDPAPGGDASFGRTLAIVGVSITLFGLTLGKAMGPWIAAVRSVVERSVTVEAEVVEVRGGQTLGGKATVGFVDAAGAPHQLLIVGRYSIGQAVTVRYDPANPSWAVIDSADPAGLEALTKIAPLSWLLAGMGALLAACGALGLV